MRVLLCGTAYPRRRSRQSGGHPPARGRGGGPPGRARGPQAPAPRPRAPAGRGAGGTPAGAPHRHRRLGPRAGAGRARPRRCGPRRDRRPSPRHSARCERGERAVLRPRRRHPRVHSRRRAHQRVARHRARRSPASHDGGVRGARPARVHPRRGGQPAAAQRQLHRPHAAGGPPARVGTQRRGARARGGLAVGAGPRRHGRRARGGLRLRPGRAAGPAAEPRGRPRRPRRGGRHRTRGPLAALPAAGVDSSMTVAEGTDRSRFRVAEAGEGISLDELALATRNHGMPLEALRYDVTPPGLHYVLTHYDIPAVDPGSWRLSITGAVERPIALGLAELMRRPAVTSRVLLECAGNGRAHYEPRPVSQPWLLEAVGSAEWTGTPLARLLEEAGISPAAVDVAFTAADHGVERGVEQDYARGLPLAEALRPDVLLVWAMNGAPLPPQHGAPLRLLVPGWYGMAQVKWLTGIEVLDRAFDGFQNASAYRFKVDAHDDGDPVTRIRPRALLAPPGWPDFMTRERFVHIGTVRLTGRAWSGGAPVARVEVSTDGGRSWAEAQLSPADPAHPYAWRAWNHDWTAVPGRCELLARATDADGGTQPVEQVWNRQGMANNLVQRVPVTVLAPASGTRPR